MTQRATRQRGYNLVEVLVAMGLLSTVLISIVTLFFMGSANVYSGKQLTRATSVATSVVEDLTPLNPGRTYEAFTIDAATVTEDTPKVGTTVYEDAIIRSTDDLTPDADGYLARWTELIPADRLADGRVTLVFQPRSLVDPADVTSARILRITIVVQWNESRREREVVLETTKLNRRA
ncbi:MAG TPA: type II secretion system protein [Thermoanaerobaculia bacterium]|nr:type II secretion system protein [Thermoanaerobaculia bacterium]